MSRIQTQYAKGTPVPWNRELRKIAVMLHEGTFEDVKMSALSNNRTISMEIKSMVEAAVAASKKLGGER